MGSYLLTVVETWDRTSGHWVFHYSNHLQNNECRHLNYDQLREAYDKTDSNPLYTMWKDYALHEAMHGVSKALRNLTLPEHDMSEQAKTLVRDESDCDYATVAKLLGEPGHLLKRSEEASRYYKTPWSFERLRDVVVPTLQRLGPTDEVRVVWGFSY